MFGEVQPHDDEADDDVDVEHVVDVDGHDDHVQVIRVSSSAANANYSTEVVSRKRKASHHRSEADLNRKTTIVSISASSPDANENDNIEDDIDDLEAADILNVIEDSFKLNTTIPSPKLDQEDIDLLNALMRNHETSFVKEPSFEVSDKVAKGAKNDTSEDDKIETDEQHMEFVDDDEDNESTKEIAPPSPFTNNVVEFQIEQNTLKKECGSFEDLKEPIAADKEAKKNEFDRSLNREPPAESPISILNDVKKDDEDLAAKDVEKRPLQVMIASEPSKTQESSEKDKPKLRDLDESANLIDDFDDDSEPEHNVVTDVVFIRPKIDCDVLNSVIVEENDEDMQSTSSIIFEPEKIVPEKFESEKKVFLPLEKDAYIANDVPNDSNDRPLPYKAICVGGMNSSAAADEKDLASNHITILHKKVIPEQSSDHVNANETKTTGQEEDTFAKVKVDYYTSSASSPTSHANEKKENQNNDDDGDDVLEIVAMGKETDVDDEDEEDERNDGNFVKLYHSKMVTCVDDSDDDDDIEDVDFDLKVPNESWTVDTEFKSSHDRPRPVGCSSDSPSGASYNSAELHYDSLDEPEVPVLVQVRTTPGGPLGGVNTPLTASTTSSTGSKPKRSLPPIPKDHSVQQQRAYEILRSQWQYAAPSQTISTQSANDSLEDISSSNQFHSHVRHVEGQSSDPQPDFDESLVHQALNLTSKRQLPKPPPVSPIVLLNDQDSGCVSLDTPSQQMLPQTTGS